MTPSANTATESSGLRLSHDTITLDATRPPSAKTSPWAKLIGYLDSVDERVAKRNERVGGTVREADADVEELGTDR